MGQIVTSIATQVAHEILLTPEFHEVKSSPPAKIFGKQNVTEMNCPYVNIAPLCPSSYSLSLRRPWRDVACVTIK